MGVLLGVNGGSNAAVMVTGVDVSFDRCTAVMVTGVEGSTAVTVTDVRCSVCSRAAMDGTYRKPRFAELWRSGFPNGFRKD